jgi:hypothetical protein
MHAGLSGIFAACDSVDNNIDDSRKEGIADGFASEQQPQTDGAEHRFDHLPRCEEMFPGFTHYRRWATGRQIPVLRLEPLP